MPNLKLYWVIIGAMLLALVGLQVAALIPVHAASTCPTASTARLAVATACPTSSPTTTPAQTAASDPVPSDPSQVAYTPGILPPVTGDGSSQSPRSFTMLALGLGIGLLVGVICGSFVGLRRRRTSDPSP